MNKFSLQDYLTLLLCPSLGPKTLSKWLAAHVHAIESRHDLDYTLLNESHQAYFAAPPHALINRYMVEIDAKQIQWVGLFDEAYPTRLKEISAPPLILFYFGDVSLLQAPQLAIVGTRNPTVSGKETAYEFAFRCAEAGLTITSGLALGVDTSAHQGALAAKCKTVAVLGTGVDVIYPKRNQSLYRDIIGAGLVVSEFLPGTVPKPEHFPRRNRIVSGLSLGTLVVEAEIKSGSLITARYALEQNREVFAVPGSIRNSMAQGCHYLIKQGAKLCENAEDILSEFALFYENRLYINVEPTKKIVEACPVLNCLGYEATSIDALQLRTQWPIEELTARLLDLELEDKVAKVAEGYMKVARG